MTELDCVGEAFVHSVRDEALTQALRVLSGQHPAPIYADLQQQLSELGELEQKAVQELVLLSVDYGIARLLTLVQETTDGVGAIAGELEQSSLTDLVETSDGLVGELVTEDGWVSRFSRFPPSLLTS